jgi:hypothetical protein
VLDERELRNEEMNKVVTNFDPVLLFHLTKNDILGTWSCFRSFNLYVSDGNTLKADPIVCPPQKIADV